MKSTRELIQDYIDKVGYITYGHLPCITQATCAQRVLRTMIEKKPLPYIRIKSKKTNGEGYKLWFKDKSQFRKMLSKIEKNTILLSWKLPQWNDGSVCLSVKTYKEAMGLLKE